MVSYPPGCRDVMLKIFWLDPAYTERIEAAYRELFAYMDERLADLRPEGDTSFLAHLAREQQEGNVRPEEVRDWVIFALEGSTDNTVHQIALLLGRLLETPELWHRVLADPELITVVTEESMRQDARTRVIHREAAEDIEVPGGTIKSGTDMFFWIRGAHLDPRVFKDPHDFLLDRPRSPGPLMYGRGPYSCLGQWMARMEVQETLRAVIERFPHIQLAGAPRRSVDMFSRSADSLSVVLAP
jgi:cytochrome P450